MAEPRSCLRKNAKRRTLPRYSKPQAQKNKREEAMNKKNKAIVAIAALVAFANAGCVSKNSEAAEKEAKEQEVRLTVQLDEDIEETRRLIKAGVDVNARDSEGCSALMKAANAHALDSVQFLIETGADVNAKDKYGRTALMLAEERKAADVAALLKAAGAKE
ncbi:MAG: ankyrin repeat domain-containing protein [Treponemataceae bacterium]|nr:ankyrin repeat domain-containing protein [Treponemataceae bacterium]